MTGASERFFVWVWRLNGLALLGLAVAGLVSGLGLAINIALFASHERPDDKLTEVAGVNLRSQDLRLANFQEIAGTSFLFARLAGPSEYIGSGSSGGLGKVLLHRHVLREGRDSPRNGP